MSDGMGREFTYPSSHATNRYFIPNWGSYYRFARWEDSVIGYQKFVQYKYKGGNYLSFLKRIGYAESPNYVHTVAKVARQLFEQLQAEGRLS